jgi:hypothetical protein
MRRVPWIIALLSAILLGLLFSACGGDAPTAPPPAGADVNLPTFRYFYTDN